MKKEDKILSTKEMILQKALEIINEGGMMDFRIDVLALSLGLSPGNITYHFAKKEDISLLLWQMFIEELNKIANSVTKILDVKQSFIILRSICELIYEKRGVVMFASSDSRVLSDKNYTQFNMNQISDTLFMKIIEQLTVNGYIKSASHISKMDNEYRNLLLRWWISKESIKLCQQDHRTINPLSFNAMLILNTIYPDFTDEGKEQYHFLEHKIEGGLI